MGPLEFLRFAWADTTTRLIFPGILLAFGSFLAFKPMIGGSLVCDDGICIQQHIAAFGTVKETMTFPTSDIRGFKEQSGNSPGETRVLIEVNGYSQPLTQSFTPDSLETTRIVAEGSRFIAEGGHARFVAGMLVGGARSFIQPVALLMLVIGAALGGHTLSRIPRSEFTL